MILGWRARYIFPIDQGLLGVLEYSNDWDPNGLNFPFIENFFAWCSTPFANR